MAMKSRKNLLAVLAVSVIAMAVAIAGCSSNGDNGGTPPATTPTVAELFVTAQIAKTAALTASKAAADILGGARDPSAKFDIESVKGESAKATENARKAIDAKKAATEAVTAAKAALTSAEEALTSAEEAEKKGNALPANSENRKILITAIKAAVTAAREQVAAAEAHRGSEDLKEAVAAVTGMDAKKPRVYADHGKKVAVAVFDALMLSSVPGSNGGAKRVDHHGDHRADQSGVADNTVYTEQKDDRIGKTWAEIVGMENIVRKQILLLGAIKTVNAVLLSNMAHAVADDAENPPNTGEVKDGIQFDDGTYMGIRGTILCRGDDCKVDGRKVTGSWYFAPGMPKEKYVEDGKGLYEVETAYATYGHWLTVDGDDGTVTVHTYNSNAYTETPDWKTMKESGDVLTDESATYTGSAAGMSVHRSGDAISSGKFTAAVTLTAQFHTTAPTLSGRVSDFEGAAVGSEDWSVRFVKAPVNKGEVVGGTTVASGREGIWSATSYGNTDARPTGIHGDFNAHFSDGHAAGAYATRKQ